MSNEHTDKPFLLLSTDYYNNRVTKTNESNKIQALFLRELFEDPNQVGRTLVEALENTWDTTKEFTQGFTYRYLLNNASLILPLTDPLDPRGVEMRRRLEEVKQGSVAFQAGQGAADLAGVAQGMLEVLNGLGLIGGGAASVPMTGGASVGAIALGWAEVVHGAAVAGASVEHLFELISYVFAASMGGGETPSVTIIGSPDYPHELSQVTRYGQLEGAVNLNFQENIVKELKDFSLPLVPLNQSQYL